MPLDEGKVSLKSVQHNLSRFKSSLPILYSQLRDHVEKIKTAKREADIKALNKEQISASKTFKNLKLYLKELDELENRVFFSDLDKFKSIADPLREAAYQEIVNFVQLDDNLDRIERSDIVTPTHSTSEQCTYSASQQGEGKHPPQEDPPQQDAPHSSSQLDEAHPELMSIQDKKSAEEDLKQLEATAESWNNLQQDIQDVAEIMTSLSKLVKKQGEELDTLEQNIEVAKTQTSLGLLEIIKARRAKFASVPVAGAVVGCMVGGPLGMLVGFKVAGVLTAAVGTFVGYKSGKFLRNKVNEGIEEDGIEGMLVAPTLGAYEDEGDLTDNSGEFQQFDQSEIRLSENFR